MTPCTVSSECELGPREPYRHIQLCYGEDTCVENPFQHKLDHIPFLHGSGSTLPCIGNVCEALVICQGLWIHLSHCRSPLWVCSTSIAFPTSPSCQRLNSHCYSCRSSTMGKILKNVLLYFPVCFSLQSTAHCSTHFLFENCVSFRKLKASPEGHKITADRLANFWHHICPLLPVCPYTGFKASVNIRNQTQPLFLEIRALLSLAVVAVENMTSSSKTEACRHALQEVSVLAWAGWVLARQPSQLQEGHRLARSGCETAPIGCVATLCLQLNTNCQIWRLKDPIVPAKARNVS